MTGPKWLQNQVGRLADRVQAAAESDDPTEPNRDDLMRLAQYQEELAARDAANGRRVET